MKTLVINTGSSSIKYQLLDMPDGRILCSGLLERIGEAKGRIIHKTGEEKNEKKYTFDEIKDFLQEFLSPEDEAKEGDIIDDETTEDESDLPFDKGVSQTNYNLKAPLKQNKLDKFDELFS